MSNAEPRLSSLAQERSRRTYQALLDAAERLWIDKGFDETTVSEICDAAGVAKGTFYFYFPRKEDLLLELNMSGLDSLAEEVGKLLADTSKTAEAVLDETMDLVARRVKRRPKALVRKATEETLRAADRYEQIRGDHPTFAEIVQPIFRAALERRELPPAFGAPELGAMLGWVMLQAIHGWSAGMLGTISLEAFLKRRSSIVWNGAKAGYPAG